MRFVVRDDNVQLLFWGSIIIPLGRRTVLFMGVYRQLSTEQLWGRNREERWYQTDSDVQMLGRTLFITIVNTLTRP